MSASSSNRLLRTNECGKPEVCVKEAQRWISKCGDRYATPLVVTILTRRSERRYSEATAVQFDTRSCKQMQQSVSKGIGCDGEDKCKEAVETVTAWQERCRKDADAVPIAIAFAMADVLVGASRGVDPILVDPDAERLDDAAFPLTVKDGKGTAAWACGERPANIDAYLAARSKCSPGELIFARLDAHRVRTVSVPHSSDADFDRLFPFLELKNEREARDKAGLAGFERKLREAVESANAGRTSAAAAQLAAALVPHAAAVARNPAYRKLLLESDASLARAVREWGKKKNAARVRDTTDAALFAGRSLDNPLHDLRLDGSVLPGSFVAPAGFSWSESMPESFAAYRKELSMLELAVKKPLSASRLDDLRERIQNDIAGAWQRLQARRLGVAGAQTAAVCFTQRFGSRLDCNPHFHSLVPDAVFVEGELGAIELLRLPKPKPMDVQRLVERIARRVQALLRRELGEDFELDALDRLRAASQQRSFSGLPEPSEDRSASLSARCDGFSLQAGRHLHEHDRAGLEGLCRYCLRPPLAQDRLSMAADGSGEVLLRLKRPLANGQTTLRMTPLSLLRRLAGLVPPPRTHSIHYFGGFASNANLRSRIVPRSPRARRRCLTSEVCREQLDLPLPPVTPPLDGDHEGWLPLLKAPAPRPQELDWRSLLRRTFASEILDCPCGGRRSVVAYVTDRAQAVEVLKKLNLPADVPRTAPARAPPVQTELFDPAPEPCATDPTYPGA